VTATNESASEQMADLTIGPPALPRFSPLGWAVSVAGLLVALILVALNGAVLPAGCDTGASVLGELCTSPDALGFCEARSGWRRTLLAGLALGAAVALAFSIAIVTAGIVRGETRRTSPLYEVRGGFWSVVARTSVTGGLILLAAWGVAQAAMSLLGV
jgi:hypothetical protein